MNTNDTNPRIAAEPDELYAQLLGETAEISWQELQPFFARGALLWVSPALDLIDTARAMVENNQAVVSVWLADERLVKVEATRAEDLLRRDPLLWAVVVAPWVLVQERDSAV